MLSMLSLSFPLAAGFATMTHDHEEDMMMCEHQYKSMCIYANLDYGGWIPECGYAMMTKVVYSDPHNSLTYDWFEGPYVVDPSVSTPSGCQARQRRTGTAAVDSRTPPFLVTGGLRGRHRLRLLLVLLAPPWRRRLGDVRPRPRRGGVLFQGSLRKLYGGDAVRDRHVFPGD